MRSIFCVLLAVSIFSANGYYGSTTAPVTLVGGILKAKHVVDNKKYKRKDCPVCKGKGWYISGDGIKKVDCGYCEPESKEEPVLETPPTQPPVQEIQKPRTHIMRK